MRREELFDILGQIDDRFIIPARRERRSIPWQHYVGVAAALCVIVTGVWVLVHMGSSGITLLPGKPTDPTSATTAPSDPTDESTEPTTPTETDPTGSTEPTLPVFDIDAWKQYSNQPETYRVIRGYDPQSSYDYPGKGFDRSQMVEGGWYILDDGQIIPMAVQFSVWHVSSEYLYYVLPDQPRTVYRSDLHMEEITVIYESEYGDIGYIQFSGFDANGQLVLLEGGNRIVFYDISTGDIEVALEAGNIKWVVSYSPVDYCQDWASKVYNPIIYWVGSVNEESISEYVYYLETKTNQKQ